ncbi:MAG: FMN-binding glutamate synthase family protein [Candidatus Methanoplasma sp.]|jgi:glutamate synthase domain-containing protein 2|nr:FMN-binding glutamate synthase family protein [Candidatus Methanoplasma sp.]
MSIENAKSTTGTSVRVKDPCPINGMCPVCIEDCNVLCEVGKGALRGREVLYPSPEHFGKSTAASNKDYFLDWSHFQIMAELIGAKGIEPNPDVAFFENVDIKTVLGTRSKNPIKMKLPVHIAGLGSTAVAKTNWRELAAGAAMAGVCEVIGENVCGMDPDAVYSNGKVQSSPDLAFRVKSYTDFWDGENGRIVLQTNVEDGRGSVDDYGVSKLGVTVIERKWGQGAKAIGGEVRLHSLERALELKSRGYIVMPDPEDPAVQEAFKAGVFKTFERHSRVGFPDEQSFLEDIDQLRNKGIKNLFLKTGAYKPEIVAFTMRCASKAKIDLLTFDAAGGGTGMSPVNHMNELSSPGIWLFSQVMACAKELKCQGRFVPDLSFAGGFINETQMYKALAFSDLGEGPLVKSIAMARGPITAALKGKHFAELAAKGQLPASFVELYGSDPSKFFIAAGGVGKSYPGKKVGTDIPWGAVSLYTFFNDRLGEGLKQLMAGTRKFKLGCIENEDIVALSEYSSKVSGVETLDARAARVMKALL